MTNLVLVDASVGETRACLFDENGLGLELAIERWSEAATRAVRGACYEAKITRVDAALNAAFVELGVGEPGFLPFGKKGRPADIHEGAKILVEVTREALPGKGPNLRVLMNQTISKATPSLPQRMALPKQATIQPTDRSGREKIDAAMDEALQSVVAITGGGDVCIEQTRALVAIDVDTGSAQLTGGKFNYLAAQTLFRQLRLRGLGGIVVIDFAPMRSKNEQAALKVAVQNMANNDPARVDVLPLSRFGTLELLRRRTGRSVSEILLDKTGTKTAETRALEALRGLENEGYAQPGAQLVLRARGDVGRWLATDSIGWQAAMVQRIGPRFELDAHHTKQRQHWEIIPK